MYIGALKYKEEFTFTHINSNIPFPPSKNADGSFSWKWQELFDTGVDVSFELEKEAYVGAVSFTLSEPSAVRIAVLVDGKASGLREASSRELIGGDISIPVGVYGKRVTVRIHTDFKDLELKSIEVLGAYDNDAPLIWPSPKKLGNIKETVGIADIKAAADDPDEIFAAEFLRESLCEKLGEQKVGRGVTVIFKKADFEGERYTVQCSEKTVTVSGGKRISLLYGADVISSLTDREGFHSVDVDDHPSAKLRGFHFGLPHRDKIEFTKKLLRYVLLPMRYNVIFLEFAGGMRFDRHPEISYGWLDAAENAKAGKQPFMPHSDKVSRWSLLEKDDVRRLVSYIKELGFALIPEVQSLAHVQYITYAHPEIAELDETVVEVDVRQIQKVMRSYTILSTR